jgi:hypothetical protein
MNKMLLIPFLAVLSTAPAYAADGDGHAGVPGHTGVQDQGGVQGHGGGRTGGWERGGGGGWNGNWIVPALIGGAILYDLSQPQIVYVPYAPDYAPPVYIQPAPVYAAPPVASPSAQQYWYFCPAANGYYPYVTSCPSGWQAVPTTPSGVLQSVPNSAPAQ